MSPPMTTNAPRATDPLVEVPFLVADTWDESTHDRLRWLRENDPVRWSEPDECWLVSKYADVEAISKNQDLFTSAEGVRPGVKIGLIDEAEPRHGQLRSLINRGFTPRMVKRLEEVFRRITTESIDAVAKRGECDFVGDISVPLPILLIAEMIGIRREDHARFHRWSDDMIASDGQRNDPEVTARAAQAFVEYSAYVTEIIEDRRANPRDDLVSILAGAKDDGLLRDFGQDWQDLGGLPTDGLANDELIMMLVILLVAGNETTRNGITGGMQLLIENPEERSKLVADPSLIPGAVEEMVRLVSPVHSFLRTVTRETELRGRRLRKGEKVLLLYGAANRDPDVYDEPERFDVHRRPHHLGFGIGPHYCLGANLARMEMRVAFEELLRRIPDMAYTHGGPVFKPSPLVRSCVEMRVRFSPEA